MTFNAPRGTRDILPDEIAIWQFIESKSREIFETFNFQEIRTPIIECTGLFNRVIGDQSDIIQKEMYSFQDKGGRDISLRPEGTACVARAYCSNQMDQAGPESKLYYLGPMFRYERPQSGRYRQFHQVGVEHIGTAHPYADAEIIAMSYHLFNQLGLKNLKIMVNSVGSSTCRPVLEARIKQFLSTNLKKLSPKLKEKFEKNPLKMLDSKDPQIDTYLAGLPDLRDILSQQSRDHFNFVLEYLDSLNIPFEYSPKLIRGLDYYTETVFEVISSDLGAQNSICGGGRYNNLIKNIGGKYKPSVGFAFGLERVVMAMKDLSFSELKKPPMIYMVPLEELYQIDCVKIAHQLREKGFTVGMEYGKLDASYQLKRASKMNAIFAIILGGNESDSKQITIRNMKTRTQESVNKSQLLSYLKKHVRQ